MLNHYDYGIVGAGLFGSIVAFEAKKRGKNVLVIDRRDHIGGNCYTKSWSDINVHVYGAHIFRTADKTIWEYMLQFCEFNHFVNSPVANYHGELYNLPFNMNTFYQLWGAKTPAEAKQCIEEQKVPCENPKNLEEHILSLAGKDIYEKLVKGYTEKQWGKKCCELPPSIMRRIPFRFRFDNNYFVDPLQGIPKGGYTPIFEKMLADCDVKINCDFFDCKEEFMNACDKVIFTGTIDSFYDFKFGELEYRSLRFEHEELDCDNYQGNAVMNFTDAETPYTRVIEHKHFEFGEQPTTVISREYSQKWDSTLEPYYPMEDADNIAKFNKYKEFVANENKVLFGGRLGEYKYYDMQDTIKSALAFSEKLLS